MLNSSGNGVSAAVGVINAQTHTLITEISTNLPAASYPQGITAGPDGNVWFTESTTGQIDQIQVSSNPTQDYIIRRIQIPTTVVAHP